MAERNHNDALRKSNVHRTVAHQRSEPQNYDPTPACTGCWKPWVDRLPTEMLDPCPESIAIAVRNAVLDEIEQRVTREMDEHYSGDAIAIIEDMRRD